ncbi:MAG: hypothetical protein J6W02_08370 [Bacteroidaceae bacterium]|nr:hypothetical protein [Bacteroidaceae bacterium]
MGMAFFEKMEWGRGDKRLKIYKFDGKIYGFKYFIYICGLVIGMGDNIETEIIKNRETYNHLTL